jgi:hypothetical protein
MTILAFGVAVFILMKSCTHHDLSDPTQLPATDSTLFAETNDNGYLYFQNGEILAPALQSVHGPFRTRFNSVAQSALDNTGKLATNGSFPEGSVIVKESYKNGTLNVISAMKKAPGDPKAGSGWVWAEYAVDGTPLVSIDGKGAFCINCHSETPNRDLVRTFDLH